MAFPIIKRVQILLLFYFLIALIPVLPIIGYIQNYAVDLIFWDEWELINFLLNARDTFPPLNEFFALHNEHRIAFLRFFSLVLSYLPFGWSAISRIWISFFVVIFTFMLLSALAVKQYLISNKSSQHDSRVHLLGISLFSISLLLFLPSQFENWLWGFQIPWFFVNLLLVSTIILLDAFSKNGRWIFYCLATTCCIVASFSLAQGLMVWLACLPMFMSSQLNQSQKLRAIGGWLVSTIMTISIYALGYQKPGGHPSTDLIFKKPGVAFDFFFNQLGSAFGRVETSRFLLGLILFILFIWLIITLFKQGLCARDKALPWISLGAYAILCTGIITAGRMGFGSVFASRYTTIYLLLPLAVVNLLRLSLETKEVWVKNKPLILTALFISGFIFSNLIVGYQSSLLESENMMFARYRGKACVELHEYLKEDLRNQCVSTLVSPYLGLVIEVVQELQNQGAMAMTPDIDFLNSAAGENQIGNLEPVDTSDRGALRVSGWAFSGDNSGIVLLSLNGQTSFSYLADVRIRRGDVAEAYSEDHLYAGWEVTIPMSEIHDDIESITAYFYDFERRELFRFGTITLPQPAI